ARDRLDDVVSVEVLQRLEEVVGAAGAAAAAHVDVDDGEAHEVGKYGDAVGRAGRLGVAVAGVFDQRRVRRGVVGQATRQGEVWRAFPGRFGRRPDVDRQLGAVAGGQVAVTVVGNRLVVDLRVPRLGLVGVHRDRCRLGAVR